MRQKLKLHSAWALGAMALAGCRASHGPRPVVAQPQAQVWGEKGAQAGEFIGPRAIAIAPNGYAYIADTTGRIEKWTTGGRYVLSWLAPMPQNGRAEGPEGITVLKDGNVALTNTHASKIMVYTPNGKLLYQWGTYGTKIGQFLLVTGICVDAQGYVYAADYGGDFDRVSKWTPHGRLIATWAGHGEGPRQFRRPCGLAISREGDLLVADIANHRVQRLDRFTGAYKGVIGSKGRGPGQLSYPYGVAVGPHGLIFTVEYNTHRVQEWSPGGRYLAQWGGPGRAVGQLATPWGLAVDAAGNVYVADTMNNRIQKFHFQPPARDSG